MVNKVGNLYISNGSLVKEIPLYDSEIRGSQVRIVDDGKIYYALTVKPDNAVDKSMPRIVDGNGDILIFTDREKFLDYFDVSISSGYNFTIDYFGGGSNSSYHDYSSINYNRGGSILYRAYESGTWDGRISMFYNMDIENNIKVRNKDTLSCWFYMNKLGSGTNSDRDLSHKLFISNGDVNHNSVKGLEMEYSPAFEHFDGSTFADLYLTSYDSSGSVIDRNGVSAPVVSSGNWYKYEIENINKNYSCYIYDSNMNELVSTTISTDFANEFLGFGTSVHEKAFDDETIINQDEIKVLR